ncbi:MAG TPA: dual specificity protein phosphatase family protein [Acidimicrobiales bacterium]|nr:dual specificity protein phosphatase family protein [Acidimicrobiales bacterium]
MSWLSERSRNGGIDEVPLPDPSWGRLWLCGKHFVGPDPEGALARTQAAAIVCLNEGYELSERYPDYVEWLVANRGGRAVWAPWPDMHAPPVEDFAAFLDTLKARLTQGEGLIVHCGAGIGRAGTTATALLMDLGLSLRDALSAVRAARPAAGPQTAEQDALLEQYASRLGR